MRVANTMTVLNVFSCGSTGGIEKLFLAIGNAPEYRQVFVIISGTGPVSDAMVAQGMDVRDLTVAHQAGIRGNVLRLAHQALTIRRICLTEGVDIIAFHHGSIDVYLLSLMLRMALLGRGRPAFIRHLHSVFEESSFRDRLLGRHLRKLAVKQLISMSIKLSDAVIAISQASLASYADAFSIPASKRNVVYNCVDESFFDHCRSRLPDCRPVKLIFVGRLEAVKGLDILLKAMEMLHREQAVDCNLMIVGSGRQKGPMEELVIQLGLAPKVDFCGVLQDVTQALQGSDIFVQPAQWEEGFGLSLVEAMAMGLICVVTPSGGMREIVTDGVDGYISKDKTAEELEVAIQRAISATCSQDRDRMSNNARTSARRFRVSETVRGYYDVYRDHA